ncbi:tyrosine-type recombinase/integrase [Pseudomonas sp. NPDC096917]|uniref:tyrosine-type recombinase/integrase n=1 Tax=Pseudomonas sp. NPDC096917 TaxID=3364483 RepID=UPI00383BED42
MALTDTAVRQAKPSGKNYTLKDSGGLALFVGPKGAKQWHFRCYWVGKQARISLGLYPAVSLKEARAARDEARALVAQGVAPRSNRREARLAASASTENSFRCVFTDWRAFRALSLKVGRQSTLSQIDHHFAKDILPWLGDLPILEVSRQHVLEVLRKIERRRATTTAEKCRTWLNQLFRYAWSRRGWRRTRPLTSTS